MSAKHKAPSKRGNTPAKLSGEPKAIRKKAKRSVFPLIALAAATLAIVIAVAFIIIRITNKDGSVKEIEVPDGARVEILPLNKAIAKVEPVVAKKHPPVVAKKEEPKAVSLDIGKPGINLGSDGLPRLVAPFSEAQAREAQEAWAKHLGKKVIETVEIADGVTMELVLIPPGSFLMGSPPNEEDRRVDEDLHPVELTKPFYLGRYEVTQGQYEKVVGKNPSDFSPTGKGAAKVNVADTSSYPVETVSFDDANLFCGKAKGANALKGTFDLPTEAQWEFACRAGTPTRFHFGYAQGKLPIYGNAKENEDGYDVTAPVGSFKPNPFGLFDMHGNVFEWCRDWMGPYGALPKVDPVQMVKQAINGRVRRGGSWSLVSSFCRSSIRGNYGSDNRLNYVGFRVVVSQD